MHIEHNVSLNGDYKKPLNELINEESRLFINDLNQSSDSHDFIIGLEDIYNRYQNLRGFSLSFFIDNDYLELKINVNYVNKDLSNQSLITFEIHDLIERFCYDDKLEEYQLNVKEFLINEFDLNDKQNRYALYDKILFNHSRTNVYPLLSNILQKKYNFKIVNDSNFNDDILTINQEEIAFFENKKSPWNATLQLFYKYKDIYELSHIDKLFQDKKADILYFKNSIFCPVYKKNGKFFITMSDYELSDNANRHDYPYKINKNYDKKSMQTLSSLFYFLQEEEIESKLKEFSIEREKKLIQNSLSNNDIVISSKKNRI